MSGGVGDFQTGAPGKVLHATLNLAEILEQFEAMGMAERLRNLGKDAEFKLLTSIYGHDAFLIEFEQLSRLLAPFVRRVMEP